MAERRMFAKSVVESDSFMDMPAEAQVLYFHLNMAADDWGFCDSPRSIMRKCSASHDSMKLLVAKKFVLAFEKNDNFVVVIKHWGLNNYIRGDRKRETKYKEFMRELYYDENGSYSLNTGDGHRPCIPNNDSQMSGNCLPDDCQPTGNRYTQVSIGEVRLVEDRKEEDKNINPFFLSEEEKTEKLRKYSNDLKAFRRFSFDPQGIYELAASEGITREDLDNYKEDGDG